MCVCVGGFFCLRSWKRTRARKAADGLMLKIYLALGFFFDERNCGDTRIEESWNAI